MVFKEQGLAGIWSVVTDGMSVHFDLNWTNLDAPAILCGTRLLTLTKEIYKLEQYQWLQTIVDIKHYQSFYQVVPAKFYIVYINPSLREEI